MAAYKAGITTVLIPEGNVADLDEVEDIVKENVTFLPMRHLSQVLEAALVKLPKKSAKPKSKRSSARSAT